MSFQTKLTDFINMIRKMCTDRRLAILTDIKEVLHARTTEQIVNELISYFHKEAQDLMLSRDLKLLPKLPHMHSSKTKQKCGIKKERGVYLCWVLVESEDRQLYVGMGASQSGFKKRAVNHFKRSHMETLALPTFYGFLTEHPDWDMDAYALAVWKECPLTVTDASQEAAFIYIFLAEAFAIWILDTSQIKLGKMAQSDDPPYGGLNIKCGIEGVKLRRGPCTDDSWEEAKEMGQIAVVLTMRENVLSRVKDFKAKNNGEHWIMICRRNNPSFSWYVRY